MFKEMIQGFVSSLVYPVNSGSWYKAKKYDNFDAYVSAQQNKAVDNKSLIEDFDLVNAKQSKVLVSLTNNTVAELDTVTIAPISPDHNLPGYGKHMVYFFGRNEPYEVKFRELVTDAAKLGVTAHAFNMPGNYESTGSITEFNDVLNSGLAEVNELLINQEISPNDIILKGNCFGATIAEKVRDELVKSDINVRCFNGNSYSSLKDIILESAPFLKFIDNFFPIIEYTGWSPEIGSRHLTSTPYSFVVHRENDKTLPEKSKLITAMKNNRGDLTIDDLLIKGFEDDQKYLETHNILKAAPGIDKDSHVLQMKDLVWYDENNEMREPWELVGEYLERSNRYLNDIEEISLSGDYLLEGPATAA